MVNSRKHYVDAKISLTDYQMVSIDDYDAYQIVFPDDSAYRGMYFHVPKEAAEYESASSVNLYLPIDTMITILDPENGTFRSLSWLVLAIQISNYYLKQNKGEKIYE